MTHLCVVCLDKKDLNFNIVCRENCDNLICLSCEKLTKKYAIQTNKEELYWFCSNKCIINSIMFSEEVWVEDGILDVYKSSPPMVHQEERFNDIIKTNTYPHVLKIYPNVLANIIVEYM